MPDFILLAGGPSRSFKLPGAGSHLSAAVQCSSTHSVNAARSNIPLCPTQAERQFALIKAGVKPGSWSGHPHTQM